MLFDTFHPHSGNALIVVDVQIDFLPGGNLAVPEGDRVIPVLNDYIEAFLARELPIYATRHWHPPDHHSFKAQGGPWPPHCIADSTGAEFALGLKLPDPEKFTIISKGTRADQEAYSGFQDTDLAERLRRESIRRVFIGGLATDYSVLNTVKDALNLGFKVVLLEDAIKAINVQPDDGAKAIDTMHQQGAKSATLDQVV